MRRTINLKNNSFKNWLDVPFFTDDTNSYELVYNLGKKGKGSYFKVTAIRADGVCITDIGDISENGIISYTLAGNMYGVVGALVLRVQVLNGDTALTEKILYAKVEKGESGTENPSTVQPAINSLFKKFEDKVDKEDGKGLSTEDFTTDEKEKLAGLENYDDTDIRNELDNKASLINNKVPASQLPSYVDDVIEGKLISISGVTVFSVEGTPVTPENGKIYVDTLTNKQFRWSGTQYIEISEGLALGETECTAYSGAKGKKNAEDIEGLKANKVDKEIGYGLATIGEITEGLLTKKTNKTISVKDYIEDTPDGQIVHSGGGIVKIPAYMSDLNDDIGYVKGVGGKGLSTNDFTTAEKEKLAGLENYDDAKIRDEINIKLYGTTDVHILTDDDVWISGGILEAQKRSIIEYDVVVIPYGVKAIIPMQPDYNDETNEHYWPDGVFPIDIRAKKIICPSTLVNIYGSAGVSGFITHEINIEGDFVLNDGVQIINLVNYEHASGSSDIGNITVPKTLKTFTVWNYYHDIIIPNNVDKFSFWMAERFSGHLYVYNPDFDFSDFETGVANDNGGGGVIHGYAGSTAESFAKENGYTFVNMGSDYSIPINDSTATVAVIKPNEYYTFTGDEEVPLSSLTVTLNTASTTKLDEFMFSFETPSDISTFSFGVLTDESVEIKWVKEPNLKPDYVYEVSVVNGVGVIAGTAKEVTE